MEKGFMTGLALGMIGGAWLVANSCKARALVKKGQEELKQKLDCYFDEKTSASQESEKSGKGEGKKADK